MDCNKEEAMKAKEIAEKKMTYNDFEGARKIALKAKSLYPKLDINQILSICDVYCSAQMMLPGLGKDWYGVLQVEKLAEVSTINKQYRKLALTLHPDKNRFFGAAGAFKLVCEAKTMLSDPVKKSLYDRKIKVLVKTAASAKPPYHQPNEDYQFNKQYAAYEMSAPHAPSAKMDRQRVPSKPNVRQPYGFQEKVGSVYANSEIGVKNVKVPDVVPESGDRPDVITKEEFLRAKLKAKETVNLKSEQRRSDFVRKRRRVSQEAAKDNNARPRKRANTTKEANGPRKRANTTKEANGKKHKDVEDSKRSFPTVPGNQSVAKNWRFIKELKQHHIKCYMMYIPVPFAESTGITSGKMILKVKGGGEWPISVSKRGCNNSSMYSMTGGWNKFVVENKLQTGTALLFKFVPGSTNVVKVVIMEKEAAKDLLSRAKHGGML